ncbi:hypothetical protein BH09MYX1_BH09MYX1_37470 [soil metagenome]
MEIQSVKAEKACRCGTTRDGKYAVPETEHSLLGNLYAAWGGTSIPTRVSFRCVKCGKVFDTSTEAKVRYANR